MSESSKQPGILVGRLAPDFEVPCTSSTGHPGSVARLSDYRDRWLILMFYPQDFSLVCPTELSAMSDRYEEFAEHNAEVLAMSTDSIESHERWITTARSRGGLGQIRFSLGSDPKGEVARAYHVYAQTQHVALRGLYIIDPNSVVQYQVVHSLSTGRRSEEVLRVLQALQMGGLCAENWAPGQAAIDPALELKPGSVIAHYQIEKVLGAGGFATVYLAYDRVLERNVALKVLKHVGKQAPSVEDEARAAAVLNHPNVCTVHSIDDSEGVAMIVMEYLIGQPLSKLIAEGPTPPEKVTSIARQIAAGIAAAHDAGVVHGDLKPANVMLTDDGTVKILDFGLAGRHRVPTSGNTTLYLSPGREGTIAGTPSYMSPEQTDGATATKGSDVFSFGLIVYELLTGKQSFGNHSVLEVLQQIRCIEPDAFADAVEEPFSSLLRRMLIRDPQARTTTMHGVVDMLKDASD